MDYRNYFYRMCFLYLHFVEMLINTNQHAHFVFATHWLMLSDHKTKLDEWVQIFQLDGGGQCSL